MNEGKKKFISMTTSSKIKKMAIPRVVKSLFDSVPLKTYKDNALPIQGDGIHYFEGESSAQLTLGVFNVFECEGRIIPTDPISLATALILAFKNNLKLPSQEITTASSSGLMKMSFYGSPNKVLPMLIESNDTRVIRSLDEIAHSISSNNLKDEETKLVNDLIDTLFYDLWILCIMTEKLPFDVIAQIFGLQSSIMSQAELMDFMAEVPSWNNFTRRHPNLSRQYLTNFYHQKLKEFDGDLDLIIEYTEQHPNEIIQFKLAGYFIIIDQLLKSTELGQIVSQKPFVKSCYQLLN